MPGSCPLSSTASSAPKPGSIPREKVPTEAQGNLTPEFLETILTPDHPVDTSFFDDTHPSGLSAFARLGIRMLGHDLLDGQVNGDVALRTLLAPEVSGNEAFVATPESIDRVREWGRRDLENHRLNGNVYGELIEAVWPVTNGRKLKNYAAQLKHQDSSVQADELYKTTVAPMTPAGLEQWTKDSKMDKTDLLAFALWGHRVLDKRTTVPQLAQAALSDPSSIEFKLANSCDQTRAYAQSLVENPDADLALGADALRTIFQHLERTR